MWTPAPVLLGQLFGTTKGKFVAVSGKVLPYVATATMAEALAMKEGLVLANRLGCHNIIAESDSIETIEACAGGEMWWTDSAPIYADCVELDFSIEGVIFKHCPREANKAAHEIAKECFLNNISCNWDDKPPSFLLNSIINDVIAVID